LLENLDTLDFALQDPKGFLQSHAGSQGLIIDEAQKAPALFSYIQGIVDEKEQPGQFILTGSQNFYLNANISQTLAGRVAIFHQLPLSIHEFQQTLELPKKYETLLFEGMYPRVHKDRLDPAEWFRNYIQTYIERDVRSIKNITNLHSFQQFIALCAARVGQLLNWEELSRDAGISKATAHEWFSILEQSYLAFLLRPYHKNFNKRIVKSPKLYFYDPGLVCSLLKIHSQEQLESHYLKGNIFESWIISDLVKKQLNKGLSSNLYFWRDHQGHEVDCLIEGALESLPIEVKSARTINPNFFSGVDYFNQISNQKNSLPVIIYGGDAVQKRSNAHVVGWSQMGNFPF
jgi:predicted AAA+ superfamily ATPase